METSRICSMIDSIADKVESLGLTKEASELDIIANTLEKGFLGPTEISFFNTDESDLTPTQVKQIDDFFKDPKYQRKDLNSKKDIIEIKVTLTVDDLKELHKLYSQKKMPYYES